MKKINKILFVIPNLRWDREGSAIWIVHPYNICLLAAMIRDQYDVSIIDANFDNLSWAEFVSAVKKEKPHLVGVTMLTDEYAKAGHTAIKLVKEIDPKIITVMGGVYVISSPQHTMANPDLDYAVIGEGEYAFRSLLGFLNGSNKLPEGIAYKNDNTSIIPKRVPFINNLDALPIPAYDLVDYSKYANQVGRYSVDNPRELPYGRMFTSRGCPIGCIFCQVDKISGKCFRIRSPGNVIEEMDMLKSKYRIRSVIFDDDNFFINRKRAISIFNLMIKRKLNLKWNAIAVPIFLLDEELLDIMRESGCEYLDVAIESGSQRVLSEIIKKPVKLDKVIKILDKAKSLCIDIASNFVIGFPGETWDEIRQSISFAEKIDVDYVKIFIANPLPGTILERMAIENGVLINKNKKMSWKYGKIKTDEFAPQDLAILRAYEWDRINFKTLKKRKKIAAMMRITEEELDRIRKETRASLKLN